MAIEIQLVPVPVNCVKWDTRYEWVQTGEIAGVEYWQKPWVNGDILQIRGWLEGLGGAAIGGWLEFVLHEGLTTANGKVFLYEKRTLHNMEILVQMMNRIVHGICSQFPKSRFRMKITYETEWSQ